jgi:hypothetical protein
MILLEKKLISLVKERESELLVAPIISLFDITFKDWFITWLPFLP